jgi:PAS domain S-box-containing protein
MTSDEERPSPVETRVLLLPPTRRDAEAISQLLGLAEIQCVISPSLEELCERIREGGAAVLVAEEALLEEPGSLAACLLAQPVWSDLPVLVLSRTGTESPRLPSILATLGNVSVIERPVRFSTLLSLVRSALRARDRQYQVRAHLDELGRVEASLRESEERYRLLVENVKDYAIFMTDPEGRVTTWNAGAEEILGYPAEEAIGQSAAMFFTEEDRAAGVPDRELETARSIGRAVDNRWHRRKGGERFYVDGVVTALRDGGGTLLGFAKLMRDVTRQRQLQEEREQLLRNESAARADAELAGRMKDEFLATLSHELRTPLNAILGWAQILRRAPEKVDLAEAVEIIERNARTQTRIIEDLLDMSRIISGKLRLDVQRLDLTTVVRAAAETVGPAAAAKDIRLQLVLDPLAGPVSGDPSRLEQVFWNLLSNSIKFTPKGGRVQVILERIESHVEVRVIDSGEGIDPAFLPYVFDRFRQADAATTRRHGGLGLGLAIVKQLVEMHGGSVRVESPGVGQGSTFVVSLPLMVVDSRPDPEPERRQQVVEPEAPAVDDACLSLAGVRVLVVDDEADARTLLRRVLEDCDAIVTTAASAAQGFALLQAQQPDVVVSDIGMPGEDGLSLIRRIRALPADQGGRTPALALTAYARLEDRLKAVVAGFQLHTAKPVDPTELITMIASLTK